MKKTLNRIAPVQFGKIFGAVYALGTLLFAPFILIFGVIAAMAPSSETGLPGTIILIFAVVAAIIFPVIYGLIDNLIAGWVGGIEADVSWDPNSVPTGGRGSRRAVPLHPSRPIPRSTKIRRLDPFRVHPRPSISIRGSHFPHTRSRHRRTSPRSTRNVRSRIHGTDVTTGIPRSRAAAIPARSD